jgi:hypothetical protein
MCASREGEPHVRLAGGSDVLQPAYGWPAGNGLSRGGPGPTACCPSRAQELRAIRIYADATPSVVNITRYRKVFGKGELVPVGLGSGFVWDTQARRRAGAASPAYGNTARGHWSCCLGRAQLVRHAQGFPPPLACRRSRAQGNIVTNAHVRATARHGTPSDFSIPERVLLQQNALWQATGPATEQRTPFASPAAVCVHARPFSRCP